MKKNKHPTSNIRHPTSNEAAGEVWEFREGEKGNRKFDLEERLLESDELIRIFYSSIQTAKRNALAERRRPPSSTRNLSGEAG